MKRIVLACIVLVLLICPLLTACSTSSNGEKPDPVTTSSENESGKPIVDFAGNEFPGDMDIQGISAIHPIFSMLSIRLAPEKVKSVDMVFTRQYLAENSLTDLLTAFGIESVRALPVTNTFMQGIDPEQMLELNPDIIVTLNKDANAATLQEQTGKDMLILSKDTLENYAISMRILGEVIGNTSEAYEIADYWMEQVDGVSAKTKNITQADRPRVYHVGNGGIYSIVGKDTIMASIVDIAGGYNLGNEVSNNENGTNESIEVSMEQILAWNPDIIIAPNKTQYDEIINSAEWQKLDAVKNDKVYCQLKYAFMDGLLAVPGLLWCHMILTDPNDQLLWQEYLDTSKKYLKIMFKYNVSEDELSIKR